MTNLEYFAQALLVTLGFSLIFRLLSLRLHVVYRWFCLFLSVELLGSILWLIDRVLILPLDYRLVYFIHRLVVCTLLVVTVYSLLGAVLKTLPGILGVSRDVLHYTFLIAGLIGFLSAVWEYHRSGYASHKAWQDALLFDGIVVERVVSSVVLLVIVGILCFLLWFPLQVPRNLAVFTVGFAIYSAEVSTSLLVLSLVVHDTSRWISTLSAFLMGGCLVYWGLSITPAGESAPGRLNLRRNPEEQARLVRSLELLNESLIRSASR